MLKMMMALAMLASGSAAVAADADDAATRAYVLTMPKLQGYARAGKALQASRDPAVKAEMQKLDGLLDHGIGPALAKMRGAPHVEALLRAAGSSDTDFVMVPTVLLGASMAAASPASAKSMPVSPANIAFVKQHGAEIGALHLMDGN